MHGIPRIVITPGEPAGIGPDIVIQMAQLSSPAQRIVIADPELLQQRAQLLGLSLDLRSYDAATSPAPDPPKRLHYLPVSMAAPVQPGMLETKHAAYVLQTLQCAVDGCLQGNFDALVTGPVNKAVINDAGISFSGHTEFFAQRCQAPLPVMMLVSENLRVALATTHLPLQQVSAHITPKRLEMVLEILQRELQSCFAIPTPRILVCGLNPHAGEGGHLGREEIDIIAPVIARLQGKGLLVKGPLPADTVFTRSHLQQADAILAMYHDQGLPVLKYAGFGQAVNITLGLPIIRTSVDHGTALSLAGTGKAESGSLHKALELAIEMAINRKKM